MLTAVGGRYKNGTNELDEHPNDIAESRVVVTVLSGNSSQATETPVQGQMLRYGMFAGPIELTEEDFKMAEFHGDPDDGLVSQAADV